MTKLFITRFVTVSVAILSLSSCLKNRTCVCRNKNGDYTGTVSVTSVSDKRANEKCYMAMFDTDRETAKQAIADGKAGCLVE